MNPAQNLISRLNRSFTLKDIIFKKKFNADNSNLIEKITMYPSNGVGFRVRKIDWKDNRYIEIVQVEVKNNREGRVFGIEYKNGEIVSQGPFELEGVSTRGLYNYELGTSYAQTSNGLTYTVADMETYYNSKPQRESIYPEDLRVNMDDRWQAQVSNIDEFYKKDYVN